MIRLGEKAVARDGTVGFVVSISIDGMATIATAPGRLFTYSAQSLRPLENQKNTKPVEGLT